MLFISIKFICVPKYTRETNFQTVGHFKYTYNNNNNLLTNFSISKIFQIIIICSYCNLKFF